MKLIFPSILYFCACIAYADEAYEVYKISCIPELNYFQYDVISSENSGSFIWGDSGGPDSKISWQRHSENLSMLESKYGIYVIDQQYGHYIEGKKNDLECHLKTVTININFSKSFREDGYSYRNENKLSITNTKGVFLLFPINMKNFTHFKINESAEFRFWNCSVGCQILTIEDYTKPKNWQSLGFANEPAKNL